MSVDASSASVDASKPEAAAVAKPTASSVPPINSQVKGDCDDHGASVVGKRIRKSFGARFFWGVVIANYIIADARFYKVRFDDGDVDVLPAPEVLEDVKQAEQHAREDKVLGAARRVKQSRDRARLATAPVHVTPEDPQRIAAAKRKRIDDSDAVSTPQEAPQTVDVTVRDARLFLSIVTTKRVTKVAEFVRREDGALGEIEASGRVRTGDTLTHINGESVLGLDSGSVSRLIRSTPRPLLITFFRGNVVVPPSRRPATEPASSQQASNSNGTMPRQTERMATAPPPTHAYQQPQPQPQHYEMSHHQQLQQQQQHTMHASAASPYTVSRYVQQHTAERVRAYGGAYGQQTSNQQPTYQQSAVPYNAVASSPWSQPASANSVVVLSNGVPVDRTLPPTSAHSGYSAMPSSAPASAVVHYQQQQSSQMPMGVNRDVASAMAVASQLAGPQWPSRAHAPPSGSHSLLGSTSMLNPQSYANAGGTASHQHKQVVASQCVSEISSSSAQADAPQHALDDAANDSVELLQSTDEVTLPDDDDDNDDAAAAEKELAAVLGLEPASAPEATIPKPTSDATSAPAAAAATENHESPSAAEETSFLSPNKPSFVSGLSAIRSSSSSSNSSSSTHTATATARPQPSQPLSQPSVSHPSLQRVTSRTDHFRGVECAVVMVRRAKLLVSLSPLGSYVSVASFLRGDHGECGEIEESGKVCIGDIVIAINGMGLPPNTPVPDVARLLGSMVRPFEIFFHRASWDVLEGRR